VKGKGKGREEMEKKEVWRDKHFFIFSCLVHYLNWQCSKLTCLSLLLDFNCLLLRFAADILQNCTFICIL